MLEAQVGRQKIVPCWPNVGGGLGSKGRLYGGELLWQSMGWTSGLGILVEFLDTRCLEEGEETGFASSLLWLSPAPPRVDAFCWLVVSKV